MNVEGCTCSSASMNNIWLRAYNYRLSRPFYYRPEELLTFTYDVIPSGQPLTCGCALQCLTPRLWPARLTSQLLSSDSAVETNEIQFYSVVSLPFSLRLLPAPSTNTGHQHTSTKHQPHNSLDLATTYNQPPTTLLSPLLVSTTISDSEQRMVSELITSISNDSPPQQNSSTMASANSTRPLQHIDIETNLPAYIPTSDTYAPTNTQQQQLYSPPQQPHSASSVHSNRSPSGLYPSPPNADTLQHSEVAQQNGTAIAYAHASPPSLTPSPETRDELAQHSITTAVEGLVQQHDYPSVLYGGADSYNYSGIRFPQEYNSETTV